jgi:hypothetical protein
MNKPIFYMHITKTGGQSIEELLRRNYEKVTQLDHDTDYKSLPQGNDVYMGQVANYTRNLIEGDVFSFTFVRDPIERLVSFYNYYQLRGFNIVQWVHSDGRIERYNIDSTLPLIEFFEQEPIKKVCFNRMTRDFGANEPLFNLANSNLSYDKYDYFMSKIDSYDFIGIFEKFDESLSKLGKILGKDFEDVHINKSPKPKVKLTDDEYEYLEYYTAYDQDIYEYCLEKFNK